MYSQNQIDSSSIYQQQTVAAVPSIWPNNKNDWATSTTTPYTGSYYAPQPQYPAYYPSQASNSFGPTNESSINANDSSEFSSDKSVNNPASNKENVPEQAATSPSSLVNKVPAYFTTQKIASNTSKLSYTTYQLQLLNAIYIDMKYPNSVQKTLIAKLIGITRDQVKIWFQNRRRKDTLVQQGKMPTIKNSKRRRSSEESEANDDESSLDEQRPVVGEEVIQGVLYQLKIHHNAPSRLSTKRARLESESEAKAAKKTCSSRIIVTSQPDAHKPVELEAPTTNNNIILTPVSSSSSSSTSSSSEEEAYIKPEVKFSTLSQPISMQDYIGSRYLASGGKSATVHQGNQYQQQVGSCYQANGLPAENKLLNSWAFQTTAYQASYYKPTGTTTEAPVCDYDSKNAYTQNYGYSTSAPGDYYSTDLSTGYQYGPINGGYYGSFA